MRYAYHVENVERVFDLPYDLEEFLTQKGIAGWRLVEFITNNDGNRYAVFEEAVS